MLAAAHCFLGAILKGIEIPYHRGLHRFAVFTACATLVLIVAGALVTSNDAGLSVPDWPTSFGSFYKMPHMVGGIKYEHGHRMVAEFIGLLTIILAVWTWRVEKRRWLRLLGLAALATVITQGILGGITVLFFLPAPISSAHAAVAQTFFCIAVAIAVFTGRRWVEEQPRTEFDQRRPTLFTLTLLSIFVLYVQLVLGAMFRHHGMSWWPHVINAGVVAIVLSWTAVRAISVYSQVEAVRRPAIAMLGTDGRATLPWLSRLHHPRHVGKRRRTARTAHGDFDRSPRRRRSAAAGDHRRSGHPGVAARPGRIRGARRRTESSRRVEIGSSDHRTWLDFSITRSSDGPIGLG